MREQEGLQALGKKTEYKSDYAPEVLETFQNKHPENDYWVQFNCPARFCGNQDPLYAR